MKKILFISALDIWSLGENKGGEALWQTLKGYAEKNWEVYFITSAKRKNFHKKIQKEYPNIFIYSLNLEKLQKFSASVPKIGFFLRFLFWFVFQTKSFFKAISIKKSKGKLLIIYGYEIYGVPVAKLLSILWKISIVSRFQGTILKLVWMDKRFWKIRAWEHAIAFKIPTDFVIMTNDGSQGDKLLQYFGVNSKKIRFWMNGVNWEDSEKSFNKEKIKKEMGFSSKYILIIVSRLMSLKRVDRSIKVIPKIVKKISNVKLLIIGEGSEKERLKTLSRDLKVSEHIRFIGAVPHKEIPKYLSIADIFLSFYDWSNVGNPLIEAMTTGKSIVTLNNGDTGTIIKNDYNGILLEAENDERKLIDNISQNVINLLTNSQLRKSLGNNAKDFAKENFWTWGERIDIEIKEIEKLVKK